MWDLFQVHVFRAFASIIYFHLSQQMVALHGVSFVFLIDYLWNDYKWNILLYIYGLYRYDCKHTMHMKLLVKLNYDETENLFTVLSV